eukprot:31135-Pelagococcus_subviridis.AAC.5
MCVSPSSPRAVVVRRPGTRMQCERKNPSLDAETIPAPAFSLSPRSVRQKQELEDERAATAAENVRDPRRRPPQYRRLRAVPAFAFAFARFVRRAVPYSSRRRPRRSPLLFSPSDHSRAVHDDAVPPRTARRRVREARSRDEGGDPARGGARRGARRRRREDGGGRARRGGRREDRRGRAAGDDRGDEARAR